MTEKQWLAINEPSSLFLNVGERATERKVRLFCVECCRRVLHLAPAARRKSAEKLLAFAERYADGEGTKGERLKTERKANKSYSMVHQTLTARCSPSSAYYAARHAREFAAYGKEQEYAAIQAEQVTLARDIIGPFAYRKVAVKGDWLTATVVALAKGIYEERAFDRLPILADALQDAGCENKYILDHCRGEGPHVRGCWVVDLVLGKE